MLPITIDAEKMRLINRSAILEFVRVNSPTSRTAIAKQLDVSMSTVVRIVEDLLNEGILVGAGQIQIGMGHRRSLIAYNHDFSSVIGIDLGGTKLYGALANTGGHLLREVTLRQHQTTGEESFALVVNMIKALLEHVPRGQEMRGIAVGAPGITKNQQGIVEWAPGLKWRNFPLKERLEEQFHYPIFVDNDVNLAALGEHWFGAGKDVQNMILLSIGTGVGAGLIIDGMLYRGHSQAAGEIGYLIPNTQSLNRSYL
jgi:glucokinase